MKKPTPRPTAPDGIERLRKAKKALALFDEAVSITRGDLKVYEVRVHAPDELRDHLSPGAVDAVGQALRKLLGQHLAVEIGRARELLVDDFEAAKLAAREEYERELSTHH